MSDDAGRDSAASRGYPPSMAGPWSFVTNDRRYREACHGMGTQLFSTDRFITDALRWLSRELGDFHLEYHSDIGWRATSCHSTCLSGRWSRDGWVAGDGSVASALLAAVEATLENRNG